MFRLFAPQHRENRQRGTAGSESQQRDADDHESEVIELCHREQAGERDFKGQSSGRYQKEGQPDCTLIERIGMRWLRIWC